MTKRGERRHRTQKIINQRLKLSKSRWGMNGLEHKQPHRLHKFNFTCCCASCQDGKGVRELREKKLEQIKE